MRHAVATAFGNAMSWIAKGVSYDYDSMLASRVSWEAGGVSLTGVAYKVNGSPTPKYYVFGDFIHGTTIETTTEANNIDTCSRPRIREGNAAIHPHRARDLVTNT